MAFSFIKAMEASLNIEHNLSCEDFNFSIPYLDYAGWTPSGIINQLNAGFQIPEEYTTLRNGTVQLCANFGTPGCDSEDELFDPWCHCKEDVVQDGPIANDQCYNLTFMPAEPGMPFDNCTDYWNVSTFPMTEHKMSTSGVSLQNGSLTTILAVKNRILDEGPLVAIIREPLILDDLRDYDNLEGVAFHSFVLTGWEDVEGSNSTVWLVDDHWPGNGDFCGPGKTNAINNTTFLSFLSNSVAAGKWLQLYNVGNVAINYNGGEGGPSCQSSSAFNVDVNEQNEACVEEPPTECPLPVITDIVQAGGSTGCLRRNRSNYLTATVECTVPAVDYQWVVLPGGAGQHSSFPCESHCAVIPSTTAEVVFIKVRARGECENVWTDWFFKEFCLKGGNDGGPH